LETAFHDKFPGPPDFHAGANCSVRRGPIRGNSFHTVSLKSGAVRFSLTEVRAICSYYGSKLNRGILFLSKLARRVAFDRLAGEFILENFLHMETVFNVLIAR